MVKKAGTVCLPGTQSDSDDDVQSGSGSDCEYKHHLVLVTCLHELLNL